MPMCTGMAQPGLTTLHRCTCDRKATWLTRLREAEAQAYRAQADVVELRDQVKRLEALCRSRWGRLPWDPVTGPPKPNVHPFAPKGGRP